MPEDRAMYFLLLRETENALRLLIAAQRRCEDLYLEDEQEPILFALLEEQSDPPSDPTGDVP